MDPDNPAKVVPFDPAACIPKLEPIDQIKVWFELLSYCEPKARSGDREESEVDNDELMEMFKDVSDETLLKLIKSEEQGSD